MGYAWLGYVSFSLYMYHVPFVAYHPTELFEFFSHTQYCIEFLMNSQWNSWVRQIRLNVHQRKLTENFTVAIIKITYVENEVN